MKKGFLIMVLCTFVCGVSAATEIIAFRQSSTLYILPEDQEGGPILVGRATGSYQVGASVIAFMNASDLWVASDITHWAPVLMANNVQSYQVAPSGAIFFKSGNELYQVVDKSREQGYTLIANGIRDFETVGGSRTIIRKN